MEFFFVISKNSKSHIFFAIAILHDECCTYLQNLVGTYSIKFLKSTKNGFISKHETLRYLKNTKQNKEKNLLADNVVEEFFSLNMCQMDVFFGFWIMVKYLNNLKKSYNL